MATSNRKPQQPRSSTPRARQTEPALLIDPRWILKALAALVAFAVVLAYATLCLLFYQGQWQLVLHPSRTVASSPAALGLAFKEVHFFPAASGDPQLDGWLVPAEASAVTALVLHDGYGSISDALPTVRSLHNAGLNVLLFDYRGFGRSSGHHPDQTSMQEDAAGALAFLTDTQHIQPSEVILYGSGLGASLAVRVATDHRNLPALILDSPDGDFAERARMDPRARLVPTRWLFDQTFPLAEPLQRLTTPKLLISYMTGPPPEVIQRAADPKVTVEFTSHNNETALVAVIHRFVDAYVSPRQPSLAVHD